MPQHKTVLDFVDTGDYMAADEERHSTYERSEPCFLGKDATEDQIRNFSRVITPLRAIRGVYGFKWPTRYARTDKENKTTIETSVGFANLFGEVKITGLGDWKATTFDPSKLDIEFSPHESPELLVMGNLWKKFFLPALRKFDERNIAENRYVATKYASMQSNRKATLEGYRALSGWGPGGNYKINDHNYSTVVVENGKLRGWDFKKQTADQSGIQDVSKREFEHGLLQYYAMTAANGNLRFPPLLTSFVLTAQRTSKQGQTYVVYKPAPIENKMISGILGPEFKVGYSAKEDVFKMPTFCFPDKAEAEALAEYRKKCAVLTKEEAAKLPKPRVRDFPNEQGDIVLVSLSGEISTLLPLDKIAPEIFTPSVLQGLRDGYQDWSRMPSAGMVFRDHYHYETRLGWAEISQADIKAAFVEKKDESVVIKVNDNYDPDPDGQRQVEVVFYEGRYKSRPFDPAQEKKSSEEHVLGERWQEIMNVAREAGLPIWGDKIERGDPWAFLGQSFVQPNQVVTPFTPPISGAQQAQTAWVVPGYENPVEAPAPVVSPFKKL